MALLVLLAGCTPAPAVQPYGKVASGRQARTLTAKEVAPVDEFLDRHTPDLGILATPATADPTRAPVARQSPPTRHNPLTGARGGE